MIEVDPVLGRPIAHYPSDRLRPLIISGVLCAVAAVLLNFTLATVEAWWGPTGTMLLMGALVLGCGWYVLHIWNREVILFERGFSYREGSNTVYFVYTEVKSIRQRAERLRYFGGLWRRTVYRITVRTVRDEVITLTNVYKRIDELGIRLEAAYNNTRRPVVERLLRQGEVVKFGEHLGLNAEGFVAGERTLTWATFAGYKAQGGRLIVLKQGGDEWARVPLEEIDNVTLLLDLVKAHQKLAQ